MKYSICYLLLLVVFIIIIIDFIVYLMCILFIWQPTFHFFCVCAL